MVDGGGSRGVCGIGGRVGRVGGGGVGGGGGVEEGLAGGGGWLFERRGHAVQRAEAKHAAEGAGAAPVAGGGDGDGAGDVVFVVVDEEAEGAVEVLGVVG